MLKPLVAAVALTAVAMTGAVSQATAKTVWVYPYKGTPYAVPHEHAKQANTPLKAKKKATRENARDRFAADRTIAIAHHKPGYHDGLPRTPRSEEPEGLPQSTA